MTTTNRIEAKIADAMPLVRIGFLLPAALLSACAQMASSSAGLKPAVPPAERVLSAQDLMHYPAWKAVRDQFFIGTEPVGIYRGQRFVVEYFCTYWCPGYVDAVYHFIDLKSPEACNAIGAEIRDIEVQIDFGRQHRNFCVASGRML